LRHSFASHLVSSGVSLPIVGKLLRIWPIIHCARRQTEFRLCCEV